MSAARFLVSGRVQGVFFRASTREQALRLGLRGYAKNLPGGEVEVLVAGSVTAIDALEDWLHEGPPLAQVRELIREDVGESGICPGFETA